MTPMDTMTTPAQPILIIAAQPTLVRGMIIFGKFARKPVIHVKSQDTWMAKMKNTNSEFLYNFYILCQQLNLFCVTTYFMVCEFGLTIYHAIYRYNWSNFIQWHFLQIKYM